MSLPDFTQLPAPDAEELAINSKLNQQIRDEISASGGSISFERFMAMALYTPGLGYYVNGRRTIGVGGDFVTAPELTPLFSHCLARQIQQLAKEIGPGFTVLEFGGGNGTLAAESLAWLADHGGLPDKYFILDVSPYLKTIQRERIQNKVPQLLDRVVWISEVPDKFRGLVIANEVLDAMPVELIRLHQNGTYTQMRVAIEGNQFTWLEAPLNDPTITGIAQELTSTYRDRLVDGYLTEINRYAQGWLEMLAEKLDRGAIILIDYGYPASEWYIPDRYQGTLMCHYRHRAHSNPLILAGLQDLTSHVDFSAIAEYASNAGLAVAGFSNQAGFLIGCGLESLLQNIDASDTRKFLEASAPVKRLILPSEMGELFKVVSLTKNIHIPLLGFQADNRLDRL
ncbi:MAG: SAM-dependent methyltransferase [Gammaproteobacteria bacterium]|nr:SAM-dependent methyltransferase [Gammaproteobacteria bacterium]